MHSFYSAKDIPGRNSFIPPYFKLVAYVEDEELFVGIDSEVKYHGQPCGMILADRMDLANAAAKKVKVYYAQCNSSRN